MYDFKVTKTNSPKAKPDPDKLEFGTKFTDHMFLMDYSAEKGWHDGRIVPYGPITLDPAAAVLHYAQELFEGLKAYKAKDGRVLLFRPDMNEKKGKGVLFHKALHPASSGRCHGRSDKSACFGRAGLDPE